MTDGACCDQCGEWHPWCEFVETIEEYLCQWCASGLASEDDRDDSEFGFEGLEERDYDDDR